MMDGMILLIKINYLNVIFAIQKVRWKKIVFIFDIKKSVFRWMVQI